MAGIFPEMDSSIVYKEESEVPTLLKGYAWDFDNDEFLLDEQGKFIIVEGLEALKVRNYLQLRIYRNRHFIHHGKVGSRLKELIGKSYDYICLHVQRYVEEAIVDNIYVNSIEDLEISINEEYISKIYITFRVNSIYGIYTEKIGGVTNGIL